MSPFSRLEDKQGSAVQVWAANVDRCPRSRSAVSPQGDRRSAFTQGILSSVNDWL